MRFVNHAARRMLALLAVMSLAMLCGCEAPMMTLSKAATPLERIAGFSLLGFQTIQTSNRFPLGFEEPSVRFGLGEADTEGQPSSSKLASAESPATPGSPESTLPVNRPNRLMVYSARYRLATPNVEEALRRFVARVEQMGGYLESRENGRVVCRVPAENFQSVVGGLPTLGEILDQSIHNQDVTTQHRDLGLRLQTAEWSRDRVLALLERANKIEDVLKLEATLRSLTEQIERIKGQFKQLSEQIAYSRIEVQFQSKTPEGSAGLSTGVSPFAWINRVGVENVAAGFDASELANIEESVIPPTLWPDAVRMDLPPEFLIAVHKRHELKAITPDESKLWVRKFSVPRRGNLSFWAAALEKHLVDHRGYKMLDRRSVSGPGGEQGLELIFETSSRGAAQRYLVTLYVERGSFWSKRSTVRLVEFVAASDQFDRYVSDVQRAAAGKTR
ncbi:MAG: DUF4349 domain-containing protein [Planctomycetes bacterium]|nr:DUF4349 domain-containing protein [Planctomycetota bacterium]